MDRSDLFSMRSRWLRLWKAVPMRALSGLVVGAAMLSGGAVTHADWCHDEYNLQGQIFCDDFDRYCQNPPPQWQSCDAGAARSLGALRGTWKYHSWNYNTGSNCGSNIIHEDNQTILTTPPFGGRHANGGDEGGHLGQNAVDLTSHIMFSLPGYNVANGSDEQPLVLSFNFSGGLNNASKLPWSNGYMELALGDGDPDVPGYRQGGDSPQTHAPTDYVLVGALEPGSVDCVSCYGLCRSQGIQNSGVHVQWPTICQQEFPNAACPELSTEIRPVIAIGVLAELDNDPCHCDTPSSQKPNNWHLSIFDGLRWRVLKQGMFPGSGDFVLGGKVDTVSITIRGNTMDVYHRARVNGTWIDSTALGIPRVYTGGFNRLRGGTGVSCELEGDGNTYKCKQAFIWGGGKCQRMGEFRCDNGQWQTNGAGYVSFDTLRLSGGVGNSFFPTGSCCLPDATCSEGTEEDCLADGGTFNGVNTTCDTATCCPVPFADSDTDGDVDQDDFAFMQRCVTGNGAGVPSGCECLDRDTTIPNGIDADDVAAFMNCVSGPNVPWTSSPGCTQ